MHKKHFILLLIILCISNKILLADNYPTHHKIKKNDYLLTQKNYYYSYTTKVANIITAPFEFNKKQWVLSATIFSSAVAAYLIETDINSWILKYQNSTSSTFGNIGYNLAHPSFLVPISTITYSIGYFNKLARVERVGITMFESLFISGATIKGLKMITDRKRPSESKSNSDFDGPSFSLSEKSQSFPSGHSALAFATATSIAQEYKDNKAIVLTSYTIATSVGLSRLFDNAHWLSDVIIGSAIGHFIAKYTHKKYTTIDLKNKTTIIPLFSNKIGMCIQKKF